MKCWIITGTIDPTKLTGVVSARTGGSGMFVVYSKLQREWFMVYPGGETLIAEPQMIFVDESWAIANRLLTPRHRDQPTGIRKKKAIQLELF